MQFKSIVFFDCFLILLYIINTGPFSHFPVYLLKISGGFMSALSRRSFLSSCGAGVAALASLPKTSLAKSSASQPNIIFIMADDMGYGDLACYGHPEIKTPHLDQLATEGMKFTDCYSAAPVCSPARAGFLTGRTPNRCRIFDHLGSNRWQHQDDRYLAVTEQTIPKLLKSVGYTTCLVGKWHLTQGFHNGIHNTKMPTDLPMPDDHGFDHYMATENNADPDHCNPRNFVRNGQAVPQTSNCSNDAIVDECIDWLENTRDKNKPFFQFVALHSPHEPIDNPPEYTAMYDTGDNNKNKYYGNITHIDDTVHRLIEYIDTHSLKDNTFIFFTSDNGPEPPTHWWAHHPYGSTGGLSCAKLTLYEGGIKEPGIARWPGVITPGSVSSVAISGVDFLPTFCEMSGASVPTDRYLDGTGVVEAFKGNPVTRTRPLIWKYHYAETCDAQKPADHDSNKPHIVMRDGDWKLCSNKAYGHTKLFNLATDPNETSDVKGGNQAIHDRMLAKLKEIDAIIIQEEAAVDPITLPSTILRTKPVAADRAKLNVDIVTIAGKKVTSFTTADRTISLKKLRLPRALYVVRVNGKHLKTVARDARLRLR
ncbi:MAG: sulfatase-like hydrolase/transferase [Chitinivibrionales bacterium]|nr:sulfatase-like hydrolase/transferase [Chitinivibrionales bacterium]